MITVFIDSNIVLNVWRREIDPRTGENLSSGSKKTLKAITNGSIIGHLLSTTAMEILHGVRAEAERTSEISSGFAMKRAEQKIADIGFRITVPDSIVMSLAYEHLIKLHIDPFDAILVSAAIAEHADAIISRDRKLKKKASKHIPVLTPEEFHI